MHWLAVWCRRWLDALPTAELFEAGYLSTVKGLRLADGREVVVKVRPGMSRLAGCAAMHRAPWTAGFPCPEPLVDPRPVDGYAATAEVLVLDAGRPPPDGELADLSAAALARLIELAPDRWSVPSLAHPRPGPAGIMRTLVDRFIYQGLRHVPKRHAVPDQPKRLGPPRSG